MACSSFVSLLVKHAKADVCGAIALGHPECDQHGERAASVTAGSSREEQPLAVDSGVDP